MGQDEQKEMDEVFLYNFNMLQCHILLQEPLCQFANRFSSLSCPSHANQKRDVGWRNTNKKKKNNNNIRNASYIMCCSQRNNMHSRNNMCDKHSTCLEGHSKVMSYANCTEDLSH